MCISAPKIPKAPVAAERQAIKLPDGGATANRADDIARRRRAMSSTPFTGALAAAAPSTTSTVLGG